MKTVVRLLIYDMSRAVRKPDFCICENKDADQLRSDREADQHLCFHYRDGTIPLLPISEISSLLATFYGCTARFVSDLVGNPEDRFSHKGPHIRHVALVVVTRSRSLVCPMFSGFLYHVRPDTTTSAPSRMRL